MLGRRKKQVLCPVCGRNWGHRGKVRVLIRDVKTGRMRPVWRICGVCHGNGTVKQA